MGMEMKLNMKLGQKLVMTPMLQQAIKLLPMTRLQLIEAIRQEMEENPLLDEQAENEAELEEPSEEEEFESATAEGAEVEDSFSNLEEKSVQELERSEPAGEADKSFEEESTLPEKEQTSEKDEIDWDAYVQEDLYEGGTGEGYNERPSLENTLRQQEGLEDHLIWQLNLNAIDEEEKRVGEVVIGNINEEGYLDATIEGLAEEAGVDVEQAEDALVLIQSFDPAGVGARDLRECLLLQARAGGWTKGSIVDRLIRYHLAELDERNFPKIAKKLDIDIEDIVDCIKTIREFDPKPGHIFNENDAGYITPDIFVVKIDGEYQVHLNDEDVPKLRINPVYHSILKNKKEEQKDTREYIDNKFRSALWMIKSIEQRRQTMLKVGRSLCKFQKDFLDKGLNYLKPLVLKDVANDIGMHESTISRVTTNKYIHTPQGLFELKYFFHSSVGSYLGNDMSSVRVKDMIKNLVMDEDSSKPMTDDQIVQALMGKDVKIARRTVTKYRKELKIPSTPKRRKLYL